MKATVRLSALTLLWIAACNRPDADLFDDSHLLPSDQPIGSAGSRAAAGSAAEAGYTSGAGAPGSEPTTGGSAPKAGGPASTPTAGSANPPDNQAGASDGGAASGEPPDPPAPVCGNGVLEAGEQCDDAGHAGQDGCNANCQVDCSNFGDGTVESEDHHCYNGFDEATFDGALEACKKLGGHLATISSLAENKIARGFVNNSKWLGAREDVGANVAGTGKYSWITGEAFTYTNWGSREPDQGRVRCQELGQLPTQYCYEHCVMMDGQGSWADQRCDISDGYVCEWEPAGKK